MLVSLTSDGGWRLQIGSTIGGGLCTPPPGLLRNAPCPLYPQPSLFTPPFHPHIVTFPTTSTSITPYEQLKARAAARREAPTPPGRGQTPIQLEDEMHIDPSPGQDDSPDGSDDRGETSIYDADRATAEFNRVVAAYNATPSAINSARTFTRVRSLHLFPPRSLTHMQLRPSAQLLHLHLAIERIQATFDTFARPDAYGQPLPPELEVHRLTLCQHTPTNILIVGKCQDVRSGYPCPACDTKIRDRHSPRLHVGTYLLSRYSSSVYSPSSSGTRQEVALGATSWRREHPPHLEPCLKVRTPGDPGCTR